MALTKTQIHSRLVSFRRKWLGKRINGYSANGGQCVDECRQWLAEAFGWSRSKIYKAIPPGNAETWFKNASTTYFRKIKNTPSGKPPEGAIVVLSHGRYGHVFVAKAGCTTTKMYSLDQNWSIARRVTDEAHRYSECIGWLVVR